MNLRKIFLGLSILLLAANASHAVDQGHVAATDVNIVEAVDESEESPVTYRDAIWLGIVEGITEFLPVSSTAHLILVAEWLNLNDERPLWDEQGQPIWYKSPQDGAEGVPLTRKHAVDTYNVVLQGGTILAVVILYWRTVWFLVIGCLRMQRQALKMTWHIFLAFLPIVPLGILIEPLIQKMFQTDVLVWGMLVGTLAIIAVEIWRKRKVQDRPSVDAVQTKVSQIPQPEEGSSTVARASFGDREWSQLTWLQALLIGFTQCFALIPGFSRALSAILGGYLMGLRPGQAAEFSFLVGLPTVLGAAVYKGYKDGALMLEVVSAGPLLLGMLVSAITALLAVWWLRSHIRKWGLWGFVVYRLLLVVLLFVTGAAAMA